jgi:hypothetical protein
MPCKRRFLLSTPRAFPTGTIAYTFYEFIKIEYLIKRITGCCRKASVRITGHMLISDNSPVGKTAKENLLIGV